MLPFLLLTSPLIMLISASVLSDFLRKVFFKSVPSILVVLSSILLLQIIPLPRVPIKPEAEVTTNYEPFAIGLGFPFSVVKTFFVKPQIEPTGAMNVVKLSTFRIDHSTLVDPKVSYRRIYNIDPGDLVFVGRAGVIFGTIVWIPIFFIIYIFNLNSLNKKRVFQNANPTMEFLGFVALLTIVMAMITMTFAIL